MNYFTSHEWFFIGACLGWVACAIGFIFIPSWRVRDVVRLSDDKLVDLLKDCCSEWTYRHPELRASYQEALDAAEEEQMKRPHWPDDTP